MVRLWCQHWFTSAPNNILLANLRVCVGVCATAPPVSSIFICAVSAKTRMYCHQFLPWKSRVLARAQFELAQRLTLFYRLDTTRVLSIG